MMLLHQISKILVIIPPAPHPLPSKTDLAQFRHILLKLVQTFNLHAPRQFLYPHYFDKYIHFCLKLMLKTTAGLFQPRPPYCIAMILGLVWLAWPSPEIKWIFLRIKLNEYIRIKLNEYTAISKNIVEHPISQDPKVVWVVSNGSLLLQLKGSSRNHDDDDAEDND